MKTIKLLLIGCIFLITFTSCATRTQVAVAPNTRVITKLHSPKVVVHNRNTYYVSKGVWYKKNNRRYIVTRAPKGAVIQTLPSSYTIVRVRGKKYYKSNGVFYRKTGKRYVVVNI